MIALDREVKNDLQHGAAIGLDQRQVRLDTALDVDARFNGARLQNFSAAPDDLVHHDGFVVQLHLVGLDAGEIKQIIDQPQKMAARRVDHIRIFLALVIEPVGRQHFRNPIWR